MLKLFFASPSPYARKVRVLIAEKGPTPSIEMIVRAPFEKPADLVALNPLSKIPWSQTTAKSSSIALLSPNTSMGWGVPKLIPAEGRARWDALRRQALADGILDAGVSILLEGRRPEGERSSGWVQRQTEVIVRALDTCEGEIGSFGEVLTIGHVAVGCALGWLDFRMPTHDWRGMRPKLSAWFGQFERRPSMIATKPE